MNEMKDSGVEWIGKIPEHWSLNRLKYCASYNDEVLKENTAPTLHIKYIEIGSVTLENGITHIDHYEFKDAPSRARRITRIGDVIVSTVRTYLKAIASIKDEGLIVSTGFCVIRPNDILNKKYLEYFCKSDSFSACVTSNSQGISYPAINASKLMSFSILRPPYDAQEQIATYLDKKCSQVDTLITRVESQIDKLKQYKQSLITETVTKGLNPTVPMKDSGVEWIGMIPEHWGLSKVNMFYDIVLGKMLQPDKKNATDTYEYYLCAANVGNNILKLDSFKQMWFSEKEKKQYEIQKGDLIVVEGGDVASCDIVRKEVKHLYIQNALHRVRAKKDFLLEYLRYNLMMTKYQGYIYLLCNKATIAHFTKDKFMSLPLLVVPPSEQQQIVHFLDGKCSIIDRLIALKQSKIEQLNRYKKSLIYEYVTGKKEVAHG